ncbi:hypothetical protein [Frigoriglobus tundricola]|uniref:Uncharacterized protein n=1 Tax=Frigoriglobus tundricola TaxID=2774151 RepID=A0A6M5Z4I5_9BACT|nr:hypothetical protein [Frigoriglobus tundricola]QJX01340.1 hypothetical protein FTUN_8984 [Frigoriglobus tundricola]
MLNLLRALFPGKVPLVSAATYTGAYLTAAVTAHQSQTHQEFYPIYSVITLAAALHLLVVLLKPNDGPPDPDNQERLLAA